MRNCTGDSRKNGGDRRGAGELLTRGIAGLSDESPWPSLEFPTCSFVLNFLFPIAYEFWISGAHRLMGKAVHISAALAALREMCHMPCQPGAGSQPSLKTKEGSRIPVGANHTTSEEAR